MEKIYDTSPEHGCKWYFGEDHSRAYRVNDATHDQFKGDPLLSLVRESIQNSLDAADDSLPNTPVIVKFKYRYFKKNTYPNIFSLREHIQGCLDLFPADRNTRNRFSPMLNYMDDLRLSPKEERLGFLRISDYNTTGLTYDPNNPRNTFVAFVKGVGMTVKSGGAYNGGSYGYGKAALLYYSKINTMFVSSVNKEGQHTFEGTTILQTHILNDTLYVERGFYDCNDGYPVTDLAEIPNKFQRENLNGEPDPNIPGTDVNIIGTTWDENSNRENYKIIKDVVLKNFFLSILSGKLVVYLDDEVIDASNIEQLILAGGYSKYDEEQSREISSPRPFYYAVTDTDNDCQYIFKEHLPILGDVIFYAFKDPEIKRDRICYTRQSGMLIYRDSTRGANKGFCGVFQCVDKDGNDYLKQLEDPTHTVWESKKSTDTGIKGYRIINEISDFIKSCINVMFPIDDADNISVAGLDDYLWNLPLAEDVDRITTIDTSNDESKVSNREDERFGATPKAKAKSGTTINEIKKKGGTVIDINTASAEDDIDGDLYSGPDGKRHINPNPDPHPVPNPIIPHKEIEDDTRPQKQYARLVPAYCHAVAKMENGVMYHYVMIHPSRDIQNARIDFQILGEAGSDGLDLISSEPGDVRNSDLAKSVLHIPLFAKAKNQIKIRFADNIPHTIKLATYDTNE